MSKFFRRKLLIELGAEYNWRSEILKPYILIKNCKNYIFRSKELTKSIIVDDI